MNIPTEPIGSIPRPAALLEAMAQTDPDDPRLDPLYEEAIRDTIERFEATGSPVITDGEQRKYHNFWTYAVEGLPNTAPDGFTIPFSAGHTRQTKRWCMIPQRVTLVAVAVVAACGRFVPTVTHVEPGVLAVQTAPAATLEVLDWGGTGRTLVFLAGGGHTAHEFDEFAPRLTDSFHVIGITRRGVGASSGSRHRFPRDRITDIARVLDALALESVVLVGHSQGGMEAAEFAQAYPDRCMGIVHLDSAYLGPEGALDEIFRLTPPPEPPPKTRADSASTAAMRAWIERTQGFLLPESELRARHRIDETGRIIGTAPRTTSPKYDWFGKLPPLRWESVDCPALGLYAVTAPLETWMPHYAARYDSLGAEERARAEAYVRAFSAWTAERRKEFGRLPQNQVVEFHATGHYFFLEQPEQEQTLAAIRDFVARLD